MRKEIQEKSLRCIWLERTSVRPFHSCQELAGDDEFPLSTDEYQRNRREIRLLRNPHCFHSPLH